jgi:hypothetical protein
MKKPLLFVLMIVGCLGTLRAQVATAPPGSGTSGDPYRIETLEHLYWISDQVNNHGQTFSGMHFLQTHDIDATATATWFGGEGWVPVGANDKPFEGNYNGQGKIINRLYINRPSTALVGLFGFAQIASIINLGLIDVDIVGYTTGALIGSSFAATVKDCFSTGEVLGIGSYCGGLVGRLERGIMENSHSEATVYGSSILGGLAGAFEESTVMNCFSAGTVSDHEPIGQTNIGGLVGRIVGSGTITNCYSSGNITGNSDNGNNAIGAFCGNNLFSNITNSYSTSSVFYTDAPDPTDRGFVGVDGSGSYAGNFFDSEASNQTMANGASAKLSAEMTRAGTFVAAGWDFHESEAAWAFNGQDNAGYPFLRFQDHEPENLWLGLSSGDWDNPANWSENTVPSVSAIIPQTHSGNHTASVHSAPEDPASIEDLHIETHGRLTIAAGGALQVNATLTSDAGPEGLAILSDATATGSLLHSSPDVHATVERHIDAAVWADGRDGWHFLSSPINNMLIVGSDFVPDPETPAWGSPGNRTFDFYAFDESVVAAGEGPPLPWINIRREDGNLNKGFEASFIPGKGYLVACQEGGIKAFSGELHQGEVRIPLAHTPDREHRGWNLLGNPFPSAIRWRNDYAGQFVQNAVALYDTNKEGGAGYIYIEEGDLIPAHQGFFAEVSPEAHGQEFVFNDHMRAHGTGFIKGNMAGPEGAVRGAISIRLIKDPLFDETRLVLHPGSTPGRDRHDALKLFSFHPDVPQVYLVTSDLVHVAIHAIPGISAETAIPLGFTVPEAGSYTIALGEASGDLATQDIYLLDQQKSAHTRLSEGGQYTFAADPSDENHGTKRFAILFSPSDATTASGLSAPETHIYSAGQTLYVAFSQPGSGRTVEVYDLGGRLLMREAAEWSERFSTRLDVETGIYVVRVSSPEGVQVERIIIR